MTSAVIIGLADPSRCRLAAAIIEAGELCVCDSAATVGMSESSVSLHPRVLLDITHEHVARDMEGRSTR